MSATVTLQEFLMVAHFESAMNLTVLDLADWAYAFRPDFPIVQQLPAGPRVDLQNAPVQFIMNQGFDLPRIVLRSASTQLSVHLQNDRIGLGWSRAKPLGEPDSYPGFDKMLLSWKSIFATLDPLFSAQGGPVLSIRLIELSYQNAVPFNADGPVRRLSDLFRFVHPAGRTVNFFNAVWGEGLSGDAAGPRVVGQFAMGTAPPDQPVFVFNYTGLGAAQGLANSDVAVNMCRKLHDHILDMHRAAIISDYAQT